MWTTIPEVSKKSVQLTSCRLYNLPPVLAASDAHVRDVNVLKWEYDVRNFVYVKDSAPKVIGDQKSIYTNPLDVIAYVSKILFYLDILH